MMMLFGNYTLAENIDIGDVYQEADYADTSLNVFYRYGVLSSYNPLERKPTMKQFGGITMYTGQIFGKWIFLFSNPRALSLYIYHCNKDGHINDIQDIFYVPNALISEIDLKLYEGSVEANEQIEEYSFWGLENSANVKTFDLTIPKRHTFTGYTPKNNKCFVYPYNYILATNNNGNTNIYKYEDFSGSDCVFRFEGCLSVGCSIQCIPLNYKNIDRNDDEGIPVPKYPTIAWSSDAFTNWLTQNGVNMQTGLLTNILGMSISALGTVAGGSASSSAGASSSSTSGMISAGGNALTSIAGMTASMIGSINYATLLPNVQKGNNNGDINFQAHRNTIFFREMRVKNENMKIIDDYFTRYGYKIARIISPNITGRTYWNYVEIGKTEEIGYR